MFEKLVEPSIIWLIILIICLIIEAITLGLTTIWFAIGALLAFFTSLFGDNIFIQILIFFITSFVMFYFTRPIALKYLKIGHTKTNFESLIGKKGIVIEQIVNMQSKGLVKIDGKIWTARNINENELVEKDSYVIIREINGVKLIVEKENNGGN